MVGGLVIGPAAFILSAFDQAVHGPLFRADLRIDAAVEAWQVRGGPAVILGTALSAIGDWRTVVALVIISAGYMLYRHAWILASWCVGIAVGVDLAVTGLKAVFRRDRPPLLDHIVHGYSFPSGHTLETTATIGACLILATEVHLRVHRMPPRRELHTWRAVLSSWVGLAFLTGLGRVLIRAHWASDVIASWGLGLALVSGILLALSRAKPAGESGPALPDGQPARPPGPT